MKEKKSSFLKATFDKKGSHPSKNKATSKQQPVVNQTTVLKTGIIKTTIVFETYCSKCSVSLT